jgi:hypothetical protein
VVGGSPSWRETEEVAMSIAEFFAYLLDREPTRDLGLQLVEVYNSRTTGSTRVVGRR